LTALLSTYLAPCAHGHDVIVQGRQILSFMWGRKINIPTNYISPGARLAVSGITTNPAQTLQCGEADLGTQNYCVNFLHTTKTQNLMLPQLTQFLGRQSALKYVFGQSFASDPVRIACSALSDLLAALRA